MEMTLRWYGSKFDTVTLKQIRQIPGVTGVISTLYDTKPGDVWSKEAIHALKEEIEASGLRLSGIESVNVHDSIKAGLADRDFYIDNYIKTLVNLGQEDIHLVCYNFMPVFDWTRTELARVREDGSTVLAYTQEAVDKLDPSKMFETISSDTNGSVMPGWEPDRLAHVKELFELYKDVDSEKLFENLKYFLDEAFEANNSDIEETIKELDIEVTPEYIKSAISVISEEVKEVVDRFIGTEYKTFRKMLDGYEKLFESGSLKEYMKLVVKQNDIADLFVQFLDEISSFKYDDEDEIEE